MTSTTSTQQQAPAKGTSVLQIVLAWTVVGVPLAYGVYETVQKASALF